MIRLIKIELKKILPYKAGWVLLGLHFILLCLVAIFMKSFIGKINMDTGDSLGINLLGSPVLGFPAVWHNVAYIAGFFKIILAIIIIIFISNEHAYKTIRQNIIFGFSRVEFLFSKLLTILVLSLLSTFFIMVLSILLGLAHTERLDVTSFFDKSKFILFYLLQLLAYLSFALLVGSLIRRSGLSIGLLLLYTFVIEPLTAYSLSDEIDNFLPLQSLNKLIQFPYAKYIDPDFSDLVTPFDVSVVIIYTFLFSTLTYLILKKRSL